jgi:hypothetical protein
MSRSIKPVCAVTGSLWLHAVLSATHRVHAWPKSVGRACLGHGLAWPAIEAVHRQPLALHRCRVDAALSSPTRHCCCLCLAWFCTVAATAGLLCPMRVGSLLLLWCHRLASRLCPGRYDIAGLAEAVATACMRGCPLPSHTMLPLTLMALPAHIFLPILAIVLACAVR